MKNKQVKQMIENATGGDWVKIIDLSGSVVWFFGYHLPLCEMFVMRDRYHSVVSLTAEQVEK